MTHRSSIALAVTLVAAAGWASPSSALSREEPPAAAEPTKGTAPAKADKLVLPTMADTKPRDYAGLHNVVAYREGFYSGSAPEGEAGFASLKAMGVKTIITVDGAEPEVAAARAQGMKYIHLPIGYNGFNEERKLELVRATRDAMKAGPVYMHCHHGKHRSAGAAGAVGVSLGWATPEQMVERMKVSGTAPGYKGLYACTANASVLAAAVIDAIPANFPEVARPAAFVKAMVEVDEVTDHLKLIEAAGWAAPKDHPDLVPAAEAGRLADLLRVSAESDKAKRQPAEFVDWLKHDSGLVTKLEEMLVTGEKDTKKLSEQFKLVVSSCKECHVKYRD